MFFTSSGFASEYVNYQPVTSDSMRLKLSALNNTHEAQLFARIDLNNDSVDEWIIRPKACPEMCTHYIAGQTKTRDLITLGEIKTRAISVHETKTSGIHNILSYETPQNDFTATLYIWDSAASRYIMDR